MTNYRTQVASVVAFLALSACGDSSSVPGQEVSNAAAVEVAAAPVDTAPPSPPATTSASAAAPARLGPAGCGYPGGTLEDRRGPFAVADVSIGMTLDEAWTAIACRGTLQKNGEPGSSIAQDVPGPAGNVSVPTRRAEVIVKGNAGPKTAEVFTLYLAGPKDHERVVMIEGRLDYSAESLSRDQVVDKFSSQYGPLGQLPQQSSELTTYAAVGARDGASATCDIPAQSVAGCRRITTVGFITALESGLIITTADYDYWASFATQ